MINKIIRKILFIGFLSFAGSPLCTYAADLKVIATPHFSLIFPHKMGPLAQRVGNTLETLYFPLSKTLGVFPARLRIWLDNQSANTNAHSTVALARHILLHSFASGDPYFIGNLDWLRLLCVHEFRHAVQYSTQVHSTPFLLKPIYILGNMVAYTGVPRLFSEGEAVAIETALTKSGRGRLPAWERLYRVNLLEDRKISFNATLSVSQRYEVAHWYCLGYYLATHIRRKYGVEAIQTIYKNSIRGVPWFGFYRAIKMATGRSILRLYREMNQELLLGWQKQLEGLSITPATALVARKSKSVNVDYINPFLDESGRLMAWKHGQAVRNQLVVVGNNFDKRVIYVNSNLNCEAFAIGRRCAVWLEQCYHPWRGKVAVGDGEGICYRMRLQHYDFRRKERRTLASNIRYNALAISPSEKQLVVVESDDSGQSHLVILQTGNGKVVKKIANPDGFHYLTPSWDGEMHVVSVVTKDQKNSIIRLHLDSEQVEVLLPPSYEHRSFPKVYKDYLLYNSAYNGIDNIYAMHLSTKDCFQVTSRRYGAYLGMVDSSSNRLIFSDYTKYGMDIAAMPFDPSTWLPLGQVVDRSVGYYQPLVTQEDNADILDKVSNHCYTVRPYSFGRDELEPFGIQGHKHSSNRNAYPYSPVTSLGLSSLRGHFGLIPYCYYNVFSLTKKDGNSFFEGYEVVKDKIPRDEEKIGEIGLKLEYQSCYPTIYVDVGHRWYKRPKGTTNKDLNLPDSRRLAVAIAFPYYFCLDSSHGSLSLGTTAILRPSRDNTVDWSQKVDFKIQNDSTSSPRDMCSPWAQSLSISWKGRITDPAVHQHQHSVWYLHGGLRVPGIAAHHYLQLLLDIQPIFYEADVRRVGRPNYTLHVTPHIAYGFPLCWPDWEIPLLWFLKRIAVEGYYNLGYYEDNKQLLKGNFTTSCVYTHKIGVKLRFLQHLLHFSSSTAGPDFELILGCYFEKKSNDKWWDPASKGSFKGDYGFQIKI